MKRAKYKWLLLTIPLFWVLTSETYSQVNKKLERTATHKLVEWENPVKEWKLYSGYKPDSVVIIGKTAKVYFPVSLSYQPFRESSRFLLIESLKKTLGRKFRKYDVEVYTNSFTADQLIPNFYRKHLGKDSSRISIRKNSYSQLITKLDDLKPGSGLYNRSIALWHSHGYYFDMSLDRWEWQRARLFGTVEDISVMGYVLPYLTPMLENSGATVFLPRERDIQINEVIVDNDRSSTNSEFVLQLTDSVVNIPEGFLLTDTIFPGVNPFKKGTSIRIKGDSAVYLPDIPVKGEYGVYISYPRRSDNSKAVKYTITHSGGKTSFLIDQTIGGETWIYLGKFLFNAGKNIHTGAVSVTATDMGYLALDAIKFGGGMGNVARRPSSGFISNQLSVRENTSPETQQAATDESMFNWQISGKPRYLEGARYFLQYAGMPDTLVYTPNNNKNDYNDDYQSPRFMGQLPFRHS